MAASNKNRWGILGTGYAAREFTAGLKLLPDCIVQSVGSESLSRADAFADVHSIADRFGSYEELIHSDRVDIVYVGTVAPLHHRLCLAAIAAGKPVLCEKPFAMSAEEALQVAEAARNASVFCMEAMWSRFIPLMAELRSRIRGGVIGDVVSVSSDFGLRQTPESNPRLFDPENGGALRDLGVYPISLAVEYLGLPDDVQVNLFRGASGADYRASGTLVYDRGATATILADITAQTPTRGTIIGTEGFIEIDSPVYRPTKAKLVRSRPPRPATSGSASAGANVGLRRIASALKRKFLASGEDISKGYQGNGYQYQAAEVMRCLADGRTESDVMPLDQSIKILKVIDSAIGQR